ncbi:MAG: GntR family transcriptional regulator [Coriobacteriia bacterium]
MSALIKLDESSGIPLWIQLRNRLIYLIGVGYFKPGDQLPTVRGLAADVEINYNTVNKVYQSLERDGYITTRRGLGTFVCDLKEVGKAESAKAIMIDDFIRKCLDMGMALDDIPDQVKERIRKMNAD